MEKNRLEAFSDGVIAIIITIMILELKAPHTSDWHSLMELLPAFLSYIVSFIYVGIYWGNHHHLMQTVRHVNAGIIWANLNLLFWLSLIPFATGWIGENHFSTNPTIVYAVILLICGMSYTILQATITRTHVMDPVMIAALLKTNKKGYASIVLYSTAIALAFYNPFISCAIFVAVAAMWLIPDRNIEKAITKH